MHRRRLLQFTAGLGLASTASTQAAEPSRAATATLPAAPLRPPTQGRIPVAFLVSEGAVTIDFAGPWAVFEEIANPSTRQPAFRLYTVAESRTPIRASGGLTILPDYALVDAPQPSVLVIPAQNGDRPAMLEWIRQASRKTDLTMSICTGAFLLAKTGLLSGRSATTHHGEYRTLAADFPDVHVRRNVRFVEDGGFATSGGLSCGIDLAFRVVERYFGRDEAQIAASNMEYQGDGWTTNIARNFIAAQSTPQHPLCAVCSMDADRSLHLAYRSKTYFFCTPGHEQRFRVAPERYAVDGSMQPQDRTV